MEKESLNRINALAHKAKEGPLSEAERAEQKLLRDEYIASFRSSLKSQLDKIILVDADGTKTPLKPNEK